MTNAQRKLEVETEIDTHNEISDQLGDERTRILSKITAIYAGMTATEYKTVDLREAVESLDAVNCNIGFRRSEIKRLQAIYVTVI